MHPASPNKVSFLLPGPFESGLLKRRIPVFHHERGGGLAFGPRPADVVEGVDPGPLRQSGTKAFSEGAPSQGCLSLAVRWPAITTVLRHDCG